MSKEIGKITRAEFGFGGYDDAMVGLSLTFMGNSIGSSDFCGGWASRPSYATWTEEDQRRNFGEAVIKLRDTLRDAKKRHVGELVGVPVEMTFDGGRLASWRVLTEAIL